MVDHDPLLKPGLLLLGRDLEDAVAVERQIDDDLVPRAGSG